MCYKTIVVHVDHSLHAEARMRYAAQLAARCGAHLIGSAFSGISRYAEAGMTMILAQQHERWGDHDSALARFDAIAAAAGVASHERRYADDEPAGGLALQGRYADLVIVSQTDLADPAAAHLAGPVPAQVIQASARPVLVLPHARRHETIGGRIMLAWDGSVQARALSPAPCPCCATPAWWQSSCSCRLMRTGANRVPISRCIWHARACAARCTSSRRRSTTAPPCWPAQIA